MNSQLKYGILIIIFLIIISASSFIFFDFDIDTNIDERLEDVSINHPLGTDSLGRDYLSSIVFGLLLSSSVSILVVVISTVIGVLIGLLAGYYEGLLGFLFLRFGDIILAFPSFLLIILLISIFGNGILTLIFTISFSTWVGYARLTRSELLKQKFSNYIIAAKSYNASDGRIIFSHIFPHILPIIIAQITTNLSDIIIIESGLSFLGIGIDPKLPSLGQLIFNSQTYLFKNPRLLIFPGIILFLLIFSINLIGEGLRNRKTELLNTQ